MKAIKEKETVVKTVEVEEDVITLKMSNKEARRLALLLGNISYVNWVEICNNSEPAILEERDSLDKMSYQDTNNYYYVICDALGFRY